MTTIDAERRTPAASEAEVSGSVAMMNSFVVDPDQDAAFHALWERTSRYFTGQPGFVSLRLHRAVSVDAPYRWVNVAIWDSEEAFRAATTTDEFRQVVTQAGWERFPSSPVLFQVVTSVG